MGASTALKLLRREVEQYTRTRARAHTHTQMTRVKAGGGDVISELPDILDFEGKKHR